MIIYIYYIMLYICDNYLPSNSRVDYDPYKNLNAKLFPLYIPAKENTRNVRTLFAFYSSLVRRLDAVHGTI